MIRPPGYYKVKTPKGWTVAFYNEVWGIRSPIIEVGEPQPSPIIDYLKFPNHNSPSLEPFLSQGLTTAEQKTEIMMFHFYSKVSGIPILSIPSNVCETHQHDSHFKTALECALIAVDMVIAILIEHKGVVIKPMFCYECTYWEDVKKCLEKLKY